jgi:hypothetical protein
MTEQNHDEIARRLRESGTVPAPHGLRDDVMSQVRAEPRTRPSRRPVFAPLLPYAAAAALLVGLIIAFAHLGGGGSGSSSAGAGATGAGGGVSRAPEMQGVGAEHDHGTAARFSVNRHQVLKIADEPNVTATRTPSGIVLAVPASAYADYRKRLARLDRRTQQGPTIRVILRRVP